ncbi:Asp/Glu/hydantoin racemase [Pseudoruegeria sp. M32A2M]|nr:Asp/Glu/hydantoin racemase [Pseudoruegeria sp. M32A2M]
MTSATPAKNKTLCMLHTVHGLIPVIEPLRTRELPDWTHFNIVDESLLKNTIRDGALSHSTMRRVFGHVASAVEAGAGAVLVTCSSLGAATEALRPFFRETLIRIDEGMAIKAVTEHRRIGVLATLPTTLAPTTALIRSTAEARSATDRQISSSLCEGAFAKLAEGDADSHDRMVADAIAELAANVDVVLLAQASMARAWDNYGDAAIRVPVLTSPELGMIHLGRVLKS